VCVSKVLKTETLEVKRTLLQNLLGMIVHRRVVQVESFEVVEGRAHHALGHRRIEAAAEVEEVNLVLLQQQALLRRGEEVLLEVAALCLLLMALDVLVVLLHAEVHQLTLVGECPGPLL